MKLLNAIVKKEAREPLEVYLADWFYKQRTQDVMSEGEIAEQIRAERRRAGLPDHEINYGALQSMLSKIRAELEMRYKTTIVCIKRKGYKIANQQEQAEYTMGWVKKTYMAADRTQRLFPGVDRKCIPSAMKAVFGDSSRQVVDLKSGAHRFILGFNEMRKEKDRKEIEYEKNNKASSNKS